MKLVILLHGSHGSPRDFRHLQSILHQRYPHITTYAPSSLSSWRTDRGLLWCSQAVQHEIRLFLTSQRTTHSNKEEEEVEISVVGHSFGALVLRHACASLFAEREGSTLSRNSDGAKPCLSLADDVGRSPTKCRKADSNVKTFNIRLQHYVSIAGPHCGVPTLQPTWLRNVGRFLGRTQLSRTYRHLFLMDDMLPQVLTQADGQAGGLSGFGKVWFFAEQRDRLVSCRSAALTDFRTEEVGWSHDTMKDRDWLADVSLPSRVPVSACSTWRRLTLCPTASQDGIVVDEVQLVRHAMLSMLPTCRSVLLDLQRCGKHTLPTEESPAALTSKKRALFATTMASHRAVICKDPFYMPSEFGAVSELIAELVSR